MRGKLIVFEGIEGCGKTTQLLRSQQWLIKSGWPSRLSQVANAAQRVLVTREPGGTELGQKLRQLLLEGHGEGLAELIQDRAELLLFAADRAQHVESFLKPHLAQGDLILCDRYTDSTVAYQGYGRGLSLELIAQVNQIATGGLASDLTLWLDLEAEAGLARAQQRRSATAARLPDFDELSRVVSQPNREPQASTLSSAETPNSAQGSTEGSPRGPSRGQDLLRRPDRIEEVDLAFHQRVQQGFRALAQQHPQRIVRIDASQAETAVAQQIQAILSQQLAKWYQPPSCL